MSRKLIGHCGGVLPAFVAVLVLASMTRADEAGLPRRITDLDNATGTDVLKAELSLLAKTPKEGKKLVQAGLALAKDKKQPLTYNAALVLAEIAGELKDLKSSEIFFRICMDQAIKLQSKNKLVQSYGGLIDLFFENKKYKQTERICQELLELKTSDGKPREVLVAVTTRFGDVDFVPDDNFDTAKGIRPGVHRLLIQAIAKQGKFNQALKLVDNLIKARDHWQERALKGVVLREANRLDEAAKVYEDVLDRVTKDKNLEQETREEYQDRYRYILSSIYVDANKIDKASEQLQALLEKHPDNPGFNNDLGYIWADHDMKLDEAEKLIRKALELDEKRRKADPELKPENDRANGAYLDSLGWVLFKKKKLKEAKEVMLKAIADKNSQHIEIYDHLGDVLLALGERQAAVDAWKKGLELAVDNRRDRERRVIVEKKLQVNQK